MTDSKGIRLGAARVFARGEPGYEEARGSSLWNARKPSRFPDAIAIVTSERDVVEALAFARSHEMKVAVRGGGHSFCGSPLRDGGMLIDLSQLRELSIDPASRVASVQPGISSGEFALALAEQGLAFPVGHENRLPLSGYLLSGGLGWNVGVWGPACLSIRSVDVVAADGSIVTADQHQNSDLYWAARGAGAGFFGVATRFSLALYPLPACIRMSRYHYALTEAEVVGRWAADIASELPAAVEMRLILESAAPGPAAARSAKGVTVLAVAFADSEPAAARALSVIESCPSLGREFEVTAVPVTIEALQAKVATSMPEGHRYIEDSMWTDKSPSELMSLLAEQFAAAPSEKSFVHVAPLPSLSTTSDAAFTALGRTVVWPCSVWGNAAQDAANETWLRAMMRSIQPLGVGHYIAGADLLADPLRSVGSFAVPNWAKLQRLKRQYDPEDRFFSFLTP